MIVERRLLRAPRLAAHRGRARRSTLIGLATIYSVTWDFRTRPAGRASSGRRSTRCRSALAALVVCLVDRLPHAGAAVAAHLRRARRWRWSTSRSSASCAAARGAGLPLGGFSLQPSEFAPHRGGARARDVLRRGPAQRALDRRTGRRRASCSPCRSCSSSSSPTSARPRRSCRCFSASSIVAGLRLRWLVDRPRSSSALLSPVIWQLRHAGLPEASASRPSSIRRRTRAATATSRFRPRSRSGPAACSARGFSRAPRAATGSCPVAHNDFVFSVLAEEHGFLGVLVTLGAVSVRDRAESRRRQAGARTGSGPSWSSAIISGFAFQVLYNITMSAGLAPVKGLTLPLMSYGGSSLVATLAGFGLILNVQDEAVYELSVCGSGVADDRAGRQRSGVDVWLLLCAFAVCARAGLAGGAAGRRRATGAQWSYAHEQGDDHLLDAATKHVWRSSRTIRSSKSSSSGSTRAAWSAISTRAASRKCCPGMQSAFVDLGLERDAFLYVTDVISPTEEALEDDEDTPAVGGRAA